MSLVVAQRGAIRVNDEDPRRFPGGAASGFIFGREPGTTPWSLDESPPADTCVPARQPAGGGGASGPTSRLAITVDSTSSKKVWPSGAPTLIISGSEPSILIR